MDPTGDDPAPARAARRSSGACRRDSGTNTLVHWPEGESSPYGVQHQAKRRRVYTVPDPELLAIGQNQFQRRSRWPPFSEERTAPVRSFVASCANSKRNDLRRPVLGRTPEWFGRWPPARRSACSNTRVFRPSSPTMPHLQPAAEGWITRRLRMNGAKEGAIPVTARLSRCYRPRG